MVEEVEGFGSKYEMEPIIDGKAGPESIRREA
jgi:hypothetical protein